MRLVRLVGVSGGLALALISFFAFAPGYLLSQGFPLDDSWIHAVYGRELARSGLLAYNPGIRAAGETSPLWAIVFALPHLVTQEPSAVVIAMKAIGFGFHAWTVMLAWLLAERLRARPSAAATAAMLVALHPDLLAASVSGMEVPLATALGLWVTLETLRGASWRLALAAFLAPLGRPEIACLAALVIGARIVADRRGQFGRALVAGGGTVISAAVVAARNVLVTGRPMPSTFYAKVTSHDFSPWFLQWFGFRYMLEQIALTHILLLAPLAAFALWLLARPLLKPPVDDDAADAAATNAATAAVFLAGLGFFAVTFALVPPLGVTAFYFQRYSLPGLPLVLIGVPLLIDVALRGLPAARVPILRGALACALAVGLLAPMPARLWRLANDTRNIDDVPVAEAQSLADASPDQVVWAVDAGAIRYFGRPFVVDVVGLNTPEVLSAERDAYLRRHRPHYFSVMGGLADVDPESRRVMIPRVFAPTTPYTVTKFLPQAAHYLLRCPPQPHTGVFTRGRWAVNFECGSW